MKNKIRILIFSTLASVMALSAPALADTHLPLQSFRKQGATNHCWAYAAAHLIEARSQLETSFFSELNVEENLFYWVLYDRLFHRYKTKGPMTGLKDSHGQRKVVISDDRLTSEYGTPQEFFESFLKHGHALTHSQKIMSPPDSPQLLPFLAPKKSFDEKRMDSQKLAESLDKINNDAEADRLIRKTLDSLMGRPAENPKLSKKLLPWEKGDDLKLVSLKVTQDPKRLHQWDTFSSGRFSAYFVTFEEAKEYIRRSLKQGWAAIVNTDGPGGLHSWNVIGDRKDEFAAVDSRGAYEWRTLNASKTESVWIVNTVL